MAILNNNAYRTGYEAGITAAESGKEIEGDRVATLRDHAERVKRVRAE